MTPSDNSALRSFVDGVRASILAGTVSATDPLERFLDEIFGSRTDVSLPLPSAEEMWAAFTEQVSTAGLVDDIVAAYRERFALFVRDRYSELLRPAWNECSRAATFSLLRRNVDDHDVWRCLGLRFGFGYGSAESMTDEEIGRMISRDARVVAFGRNRAISTMRASNDAEVLKQLSGRGP